MRYLSLFTGIGGFELGIGPEHECVGYSEIDKYAVQIYQQHFPEHHNFGDITKINETVGVTISSEHFAPTTMETASEKSNQD